MDAAVPSARRDGGADRSVGDYRWRERADGGPQSDRRWGLPRAGERRGPPDAYGHGGGRSPAGPSRGAYDDGRPRERDRYPPASRERDWASRDRDRDYRDRDFAGRDRSRPYEGDRGRDYGERDRHRDRDWDRDRDRDGHRDRTGPRPAGAVDAYGGAAAPAAAPAPAAYAAMPLAAAMVPGMPGMAGVPAMPAMPGMPPPPPPPPPALAMNPYEFMARMAAMGYPAAALAAAQQGMGLGMGLGMMPGVAVPPQPAVACKFCGHTDHASDQCTFDRFQERFAKVFDRSDRHK